MAMALQSDALFDKIKAKVAEISCDNRKLLAVIQYNITDEGKLVKQWTVDLKELVVSEGAYSGSADMTITIDDATMAQLANREISPAEAIESGRLREEGDPEVIRTFNCLVMERMD